MPIGGHPPGLDPAFGLLICRPCSAGAHADCRPVKHNGRRYFCECPGWDDGRLHPCLPIKERP